jgi:hypothetical protein
MTTARPSELDEPTSSPACADARRLMSLLAVGSLGAAEATTLREHTAGCPDCHESYVATVEGAARMGRAAREERVERERTARRATQRRMALAATGDRGSPAARTLRPMLWVSAFALLVIVVRSITGGPPPFEVRWTAGEVHVSGHSLDRLQPEGEARRGDTLTTGADGRLAFTRGDFEALLDPRSQVLVESAVPPRLRLVHGALSATGACEITSQSGVVTLEAGTVQVVHDAGRLGVLCKLGTVRVVTAEGEAVLAAGERWPR